MEKARSRYLLFFFYFFILCFIHLKLKMKSVFCISIGVWLINFHGDFYETVKKKKKIISYFFWFSGHSARAREY